MDGQMSRFNPVGLFPHPHRNRFLNSCACSLSQQICTSLERYLERVPLARMNSKTHPTTMRDPSVGCRLCLWPFTFYMLGEFSIWGSRLCFSWRLIMCDEESRCNTPNLFFSLHLRLFAIVFLILRFMQETETMSPRKKASVFVAIFTPKNM